MRAPTDKHAAIIKSRARRAAIRARAFGLPFEMDDLIAEGYFVFVRARHRYASTRTHATFSTYLFSALDKTYVDLFRRAAVRRRLKTVPYEEEKHAVEAPESDLELAHLVQFFRAKLKRDIDKEVLVEMVFPSELTLAIATIFSLRAKHVASRRDLIVGGGKNLVGRRHLNTLRITSEVIARSLHVTESLVKKAQHRIRKLIRDTNLKEM